MLSFSIDWLIFMFINLSDSFCDVFFFLFSFVVEYIIRILCL